jgi:flagellum-specific peptidoglycan hydrolase FlgJ
MPLTDAEKQWLTDTAAAATTAQHIYPEMAACEAGEESNFGKSGLATRDNNLFGMKQHTHPVYGTEVLPTREWQNSEWEVVQASWVKYPDLATCFQDRMNTLRRLSVRYPNYAAALAAPDAVTYVTDVSKTWSTDPNRGQKVIDIYNEWKS